MPKHDVTRGSVSAIAHTSVDSVSVLLRILGSRAGATRRRPRTGSNGRSRTRPASPGAMPISITSCPRSRTSAGFSLLVALHEERLLGRRPNNAPLRHTPVRKAPIVTARPSTTDRGRSARTPPTGCRADRLLDVVEQPAHVDVPPAGSLRQRAGAPHADASAREGTDAVDADRVQQLLLALRHRGRDLDGAPQRPRWPAPCARPAVSSLRAQMPAMWPLGGTFMCLAVRVRRP